jgi:hypothetical protein
MKQKESGKQYRSLRRSRRGGQYSNATVAIQNLRKSGEREERLREKQTTNNECDTVLYGRECMIMYVSY